MSGDWGRHAREVPLSRPDIGPRERDLVNQVLSTPFLSMGPMLHRFEEAARTYLGVEHAVAVSNGTSGLHLCIKAAGIGPGDEVITTPFSFVASANCILYEGARPVFVDIDPKTLNIAPDLIAERITPRTRAILPVHVFGQPCAMEQIMDIAEGHGLCVIEDACEAIGAEHRGHKAGTFGNASVFAFYPNKQMTTGEGGMIVTRNGDWASLFRSLRNQGRDESSEWLYHVRLGYNYRIDELSCALGVAQLERIEELLQGRARVAETYTSMLRNVPDVHTPCVAPEVTRMSWFVYVIRLGEGLDRDEVVHRLGSRGVTTRPYFSPIHLQPFYAKAFGYGPGDFPVTEGIANSTLALPFYSGMQPEEVEYVVDQLDGALRELPWQESKRTRGEIRCPTPG